jgi:hypothetical protein
MHGSQIFLADDPCRLRAKGSSALTRLADDPCRLWAKGSSALTRLADDPCRLWAKGSSALKIVSLAVLASLLLLAVAAVPALAEHSSPDEQPEQPAEECPYDEVWNPDTGLWECAASPGDVYWEDPEDIVPPELQGPVATIGSDGRRAVAPKEAPRIVRRAINAANRLTRKPYKWGGGHARFNDRGYDCSGAVSYVLRAIGKLQGAPVSGTLKRWGKKGEGKWITVYANKGHVFMVIAGLRFDTSGYGERGPRWREEPRSYERFAVRHWPGL